MILNNFLGTIFPPYKYDGIKSGLTGFTDLSSNLVSLVSRRCKTILENMIKLVIDVITNPKSMIRMILAAIDNLEYISWNKNTFQSKSVLSP